MRWNVFEILIFALLAAFGALARQLYVKDKEGLIIIHFISGCIIASFVGVVIFFLTNNFDLNKNMAYAIVGVSGWIGPQILDAVSGLIIEKTGISADKRTAEKKEELEKEELEVKT